MSDARIHGVDEVALGLTAVTLRMLNSGVCPYCLARGTVGGLLGFLAFVRHRMPAEDYRNLRADLVAMLGADDEAPAASRGECVQKARLN